MEIKIKIQPEYPNSLIEWEKLLPISPPDSPLPMLLDLSNRDSCSFHHFFAGRLPGGDTSGQIIDGEKQDRAEV